MVQTGKWRTAKSKHVCIFKQQVRCAGVEDVFHTAQQGILARVKFSLLYDFCSCVFDQERFEVAQPFHLFFTEQLDLVTEHVYLVQSLLCISNQAVLLLSEKGAAMQSTAEQR